MGNLGRIKKMLCQSGLTVEQRRRAFRGKRAKVTREKIAAAKLVSVINPKFKKKNHDKKVTN